MVWCGVVFLKYNPQQTLQENPVVREIFDLGDVLEDSVVTRSKYAKVAVLCYHASAAVAAMLHQLLLLLCYISCCQFL